MYAPPGGHRPGQANYLFTERVDDEVFVASIMQMAEHGGDRLERTTAGPPRHRRGGELAAVDPVAAYADQVLGVPGGSFTADASVEAGKKLKSRAVSSTPPSGWARRTG